MKKRKIEKQCEANGISYEKIEMKREDGKWIHQGILYSNPERAALSFYESQGYIGAYCEGRALFLLYKTMMLGFLYSINTFNDRNDAIRRYFEAQCSIHSDKEEQFIQALEWANEILIVNNFNEIYEDDFVRSVHPGLTGEILVEIFRASGKEMLTDIFKIFFSDPYKYRSGWPDLTLAKDNKLYFVEVKTTDALHEAQFNVINEIIKPLELSFSVTMLVPEFEGRQ